MPDAGHLTLTTAAFTQLVTHIKQDELNFCIRRKSEVGALRL